MYIQNIIPYIPAIQLFIWCVPSKFPVNWNVNISISVSGNFTPIQNPFDTCVICNSSDSTHGMYNIISITACIVNAFKFIVNFFCFIESFTSGFNY